MKLQLLAKPAIRYDPKATFSKHPAPDDGLGPPQTQRGQTVPKPETFAHVGPTWACLSWCILGERAGPTRTHLGPLWAQKRLRLGPCGSEFVVKRRNHFE